MAKPMMEVKGGQRIRSTLRKAGSDLENLKDTHARVAGIVAKAAAARAPRVTNALAGTVRGSGTKTAAVVRAGFKRTPYAGPNNWGWPASQGGIKGDFGGSHFVNEAAAATEPAWLNLYVTEVNQALNQVKGI